MIHSSPHETEIFITAADFAKQLLESGHKLDRIFLYKDAVQAAIDTQIPQQGQQRPIDSLLTLKENHAINIQACIANSTRRGLLNYSEANRYEKHTNLIPEVELVGLGEMTEACINSDRVITFAA